MRGWQLHVITLHVLCLLLLLATPVVNSVLFPLRLTAACHGLVCDPPSFLLLRRAGEARCAGKSGADKSGKKYVCCWEEGTTNNHHRNKNAHSKLQHSQCLTIQSKRQP